MGFSWILRSSLLVYYTDESGGHKSLEPIFGVPRFDRSHS